MLLITETNVVPNLAQITRRGPALMPPCEGPASEACNVWDRASIRCDIEFPRPPIRAAVS